MEELTSRQQQIIDESIKIISEKGIQHLTIKNIAKSMHFSEPAIYRHFKTKMDILVGMISTFKRNSAILSKQVTSDPQPALKKLEMIYENTFAQFMKTPTITAVLFSEEIFQHEEILSKIVVKIMENHQKMIENIIEEGQESGEIRNDIAKEELGIMVMGSLRLLVTRWKLSKYSFNLSEEGKLLVSSLTRLLKK